MISVTIQGGPTALERARLAGSIALASAIERGVMKPSPSGCAHLSVNHDPGCQASEKHDIRLCTCMYVEVVVRTLDPLEVVALEKSGDYEHQPQEEGMPPISLRTRWPAGE